jgi:5,10-methylenetetrahydrofolate reductase
VPGLSFQEKIKAGEFTVTSELIPPRGTDLEEMLAKARVLKGHVDGANVTECQRGNMRLGSLTAGSFAAKQGIEVIAQVTLRDRNRIALQSDLLSANLLGIRNILVVTGDLPIHGDHPAARSVYDIDVMTLLGIITGMNEGVDFEGNRLQGSVDLFPGAACHPGYEPRELQILTMEKKVRRGARFFQSQAIFDLKAFESFHGDAKHIDVPILAGIIPLKSAKMARFMNENIPGVGVPTSIIEIMEKSGNPRREGMAMASRMISELRSFADGVHVMAIGMEEEVPGILEASRSGIFNL